jgi:siroheme synthase (precorrin-2 oxidase/ferrochelatase)
LKGGATGLPVTLDVEGKRVLVVGGGEEAERKAALCVEAGAVVTALPAADPSDEELAGAFVVLVCDADRAHAAALAERARRAGALVWALDHPTASDLAMPAIARLGAARLAISTSGHSPALASRMRGLLEGALGPRFARFVDALGARRVAVALRDPDPASRRKAAGEALHGFSLRVEVDYPDWFETGEPDE